MNTVSFLLDNTQMTLVNTNIILSLKTFVFKILFKNHIKLLYYKHEKMMLINDIAWIITAICCVFFEHPVITGIVVVTTIIYAIDLYIKFKHSTTVKEFLKNYWLDILFLIPVCKLFRGFRIIKVGRMLRTMDALNDLTELVFRFYNAICKVKDNRK